MREYRYSITHKMRLIDNEPAVPAEPPLTLNPDKKTWVNAEITVVEHMNAVPITQDEAKQFIETGVLTKDTLHRLEMEVPDPWEDSDGWDD